MKFSLLIASAAAIALNKDASTPDSTLDPTHTYSVHVNDAHQKVKDTSNKQIESATKGFREQERQDAWRGKIHSSDVKWWKQHSIYLLKPHKCLILADMVFLDPVFPIFSHFSSKVPLFWLSFMAFLPATPYHQVLSWASHSSNCHQAPSIPMLLRAKHWISFPPWLVISYIHFSYSTH